MNSTLIPLVYIYIFFQSAQYIELRNSDVIDSNVRASRLYLEATDNNFHHHPMENHSDHDSVDDQSAHLLLNKGDENKDRPKSKG